jgi:hypothetical protein
LLASLPAVRLKFRAFPPQFINLYGQGAIRTPLGYGRV